MLNQKISFYNGVKDNVGKEISISDALDYIKSKILENEVYAIAHEIDEKKKSDLKKKLPAVTWSGLFKKRLKTNVIQHSGLLCIDVDKLDVDTLIKYKEQLKADEYVLACFVSPSANGLKIIFRVDFYPQNVELNADEIAIRHDLVFFRSIVNYLKAKYGIVADESGKDVCRLCFLSCDTNMYLNKDSKTIDMDFCDKYCRLKVDVAKNDSNTPKTKKEPKADTTDIFTLLREVETFTNNKLTYTEGSRNDYVYLFANNCNRKGIDQGDCEGYVFSNFNIEDAGEIKETIASAYKHHSHESGKFAKKNESAYIPKKTAPSKNTNATVDNGQPADEIDLSVLFWYETETETKSGKVKVEVKFSYDNGIKFLENNGFAKISLPNNNYQFVRVKNNIVEIVKERNMREFMLDAILDEDNPELIPVREMFRRSSKLYTATHYLEGLKFVKPNFKKDTETESFLYFRNCYLAISKEKVEVKAYKDMDGMVWRKQIIEHDYVEGYSGKTAVFNKFLQLAICKKEISDLKENITDEDKILISKYKATVTSIGYLLHRYKDPTKTKAIIAVDKKIRQMDASSGRSGKSMLAKAISFVLNVCVLDGKNFNFDGNRPFELVNLDHALLNFNDVRKNFDFERLFGLLTEDFTYSKIYQEAITIPFEDSPKMYISTNFSLKGEGDSMKGRQSIIEFDNYFTADRTPQMEFGHIFFTHWGKNQMLDEWHLFYQFMIDSISYYLKNGLLDFPLENYATNKLIDSAGEEFVLFMDDLIKDKLLQVATRYPIKDIYMKYIECVKGTHREKTQQNTFSKNFKAYVTSKGFKINEHIKFERDRSGGIDYVTLSR